MVIPSAPSSGAARRRSRSLPGNIASTCAATVLLWLMLFAAGGIAGVADQSAGSPCPPASERNGEGGFCPDAGVGGSSVFDTRGADILQPLPEAPGGQRSSDRTGRIVVYLFWGTGCPHCERERRFLEALRRENPALDVREYEVLHNRQNLGLLSRLMKTYGTKAAGVPVTFVGNRFFTGFSKQTQQAIEQVIAECRTAPCPDPADILKDPGAAVKPERPRSAATKTDGLAVDLPFFGTLDARGISLPLLTLVIAGMDSFNPCAFFVLLSLLGLLVHARSRNRMLLVGGVFVFFSGFIYFLFMAAWLNLFLVMGGVSVVTAVAGAVSLVIASINIKDFFVFRKGPSLTIPDSAKPRLFDRMRRLLRSTSFFSMVGGASVLAIMANTYELLCTAGFPMVFTRILTLNRLPQATYYLYLAAYNIIYVIPLLAIVLVFTATLGSRKLSERQGRILKLLSGTMMLGLGLVLLIKPELLNSLLSSLVLLAGAAGVSLSLAAWTRRLGY